MPLEKKKIVVTGVGSGIGAESAKVIKAQGATVIGVDINEPKGNVDQYIKADLSDPASIEEAVKAIPKGIDALLFGDRDPDEVEANDILFGED